MSEPKDAGPHPVSGTSLRTQRRGDSKGCYLLLLLPFPSLSITAGPLSLISS